MNEILGANETARCGNESKVTTATNKRMKREVKIPSIYMRYIRWARGRAEDRSLQTGCEGGAIS